MPVDLESKLVVSVSSRALFDLDEADCVFRDKGEDAYRAYQRDREDVTLEPGTAYPLIAGLLAINQRGQGDLVEVVVMSKNDADSGLRIQKSIHAHGLPISRGAFVGGRDPSRYLQAFGSDLFLSADPSGVTEALAAGHAAALVLAPATERPGDAAEEVRIAFDGDAVLFGDESERLFQTEGLEAFLAHEQANATIPLDPGPFKPFLDALCRIQALFPRESSPIRTALVTARNAPADERVVYTLRDWGVRLDEYFFLGGVPKKGILEVFNPHIFFDDQLTHLEPSRSRVPSAHVPSLKRSSEEQLELMLPADGIAPIAGPVVVVPPIASHSTANEEAIVVTRTPTEAVTAVSPQATEVGGRGTTP